MEIDGRVTACFAICSDNQDLQRYLFELAGSPLVKQLSLNRDLDEEIYLQLLPKLTVAERVASMYKPLSDTMVYVLAKDKSPLVRLMLFQVCHINGDFSDVAFEFLINQDWFDPMLAEFIICDRSKIPERLKLTVIQKMKHVQITREQEDKLRTTFGTRFNAVNKIIDEMDRARFLHFENNEALRVSVHYSASLANAGVIRQVGHVLGARSPEFWRVFFGLGETWPGTYGELIQSAESLLER